MIRLTMLLVLAAAAQAQISATFAPEGEFLGPFQRYAVGLCNGGQSDRSYSAAELWAAAAGAGLAPATHAALARARGESVRRSPQRTALMGLEVGTYVFTAVMAANVVKIKEGVKAVVPIAGGTIRLATTLWPATQEAPLPAELFPAAGVTLAPGGCGEYVIYARSKL